MYLRVDPKRDKGRFRKINEITELGTASISLNLRICSKTAHTLLPERLDSILFS